VRPCSFEFERMAHLYLVGNMGSGKTTVGELVAQRLGMFFTDLDRDV